MTSDLIQGSALVVASVSAMVGAFFAGADVAVTSLSPTRLSALIEQSEGTVRRAYERIQADEPKLRSRYLVGRVACTALSTMCFYATFEPLVTQAVAIYLTFAATVILTAGAFEITTTLARNNADAAAARAARYLRPLEAITIPIAGPLAWLGTRLALRNGGPHSDPKVTEAEVEALVEEGERSGLFEREPAEMIRNMLEFAERTAREVMIPRGKVDAIEITMPLPELLAYVAESGHSRYPVYRDQIDNVVGLLYTKDLFKALEPHHQAPLSLKDMIRGPANFVAESQRLSTLLKEMRSRRQHLAIVVDEFGGVSGIVTLEDVLEEIVGDIRDEHDDTEEASIEELGDGRIVADASVLMRDLCAYLKTDLDDHDQHGSIGGMLTMHLGKVPEIGTAVSRFGLHFIVRDSDDKRIGKIEVVRPRDTSI